MERKFTCPKKGYRTRKIAKKVMKDINRRKGRNLQTPYMCQICECWHLTSNRKSKSRTYTRSLNRKKDVKTRDGRFKKK